MNQHHHGIKSHLEHDLSVSKHGRSVSTANIQLECIYKYPAPHVQCFGSTSILVTDNASRW